MDKINALIAGLPKWLPAEWCQAIFLSAAAAIFAIQILPREWQRSLMDYGARRPEEPQKKQVGAKRGRGGKKSSTNKGIMARLTSFGQVPHSWFWHFYIVAISWSAFWALQYVLKGSIMRAMAQAQSRSDKPSVESGRIFVAWCMMAIQGLRRLYESLFISKPGSSPMWAPHWILGLVFYTVMSVAIWIEGAGAILESWESFQPVKLMTSRVPSMAAFFIAMSLKQNECHVYLASLEKYTLPTEGWFEHVICPHYACECAIYLVISFVAAPPGKAFNDSVLCGLLFVATNLGATAHGTKQWYATKFGKEKVVGKRRMIPYVF